MDVLLNWLGQGGLLAIVTAAVLAIIPRNLPRARSVVIWTAFVGLLALPVAAPLLAFLARAIAPRAEALAWPGPIGTVPDAWWLSPPVLAWLWAAWVCLQALSIGRDLVRTHRARRRAVPYSPLALMRLPHWSRVTATGRPARVAVSGDVREAEVFGGGRPLIAIAPSVAEALRADDIDRLLVREWARVQRRGDRARVAQRLVRLLVGWHPGACWLMRQLDAERDAACDAMAARVTGVEGYAACLVTLAAMRADTDRRTWLPAAPGARLRDRLDRLAGSGRTALGWHSPSAAGALAILVCAIAVGNLGVVKEEASRPVTLTRAPDIARAFDSTRLAMPNEPDAPVAPRPARDRRRSSRAPRAAQAAGQVAPAPIHADVTAEPLALLTAARHIEPPGLALLPRAVAPETPRNTGAAPADAPEPKGWTRAADAGIAIGRASKDAGLATGGFFSRLGKRIAGSF